MKPVRSVKNQYPGINAHLHSYWQSEGWNNFHNPHIVYLSGAMAAQLRSMSYRYKLEESLQTHIIDDRKFNVTIHDMLQIEVEERPEGGSVMTIPLKILLDEPRIREKSYLAIAIYPLEANQTTQPIAWVELLSPSVKSTDADLTRYFAERRLLLERGVVVTEIDHSHQTSPTIGGLKDYSTHENQSHSYRTVSIDLRPNSKPGRAWVSEYDVDQPIPEGFIALGGETVLKFDLNALYQKQFEERFYGDDVDYAQFPINFDRYGPTDQARIASRMVAVLENAQNGVDLETGPFAVEPLPLDEARARIAELTHA